MVIIIIILVFLLTQYMANQQPVDSDQRVTDLEVKLEEVTNKLAEEVLEYHDKDSE